MEKTLVMDEILLKMRNITKVFPGVRALSGVDFTVRKGEIHGLMGENGAGKSTLVKVLTGVHPLDGGTVTLEDRPIMPSAPIEAEALGISTVYQEVNLIPHMSVAENITLGRQTKKWGLLDWRAVRRKAEEALDRLDLRIDVSQDVSSYSMAVQQMVAIARALDIRAKLLILDEPTSSLDEKETKELFKIMKKLKGEGLGIVFITHFLDQVYRVCDRITVLRNGELVGEYEPTNLPRLALIGNMLGKQPDEVAAMEASSAKTAGTGEKKAFLAARGIGRKGSIAPFDMDIGEGEVMGLTGLLGSGRTEIARILFGIDRAHEGTVFLDGESLPVVKDEIWIRAISVLFRAAARTSKTARKILALSFDLTEHSSFSFSSPRMAIRRGLGFCSEDRKSEGLIPDLSVRENVILALQARRGVLKGLSRKEQLKIADEFIKALDIKTPSPETPIKSLSGGNQQKVLLARWLAMNSRLLILDEPTRGIDVGAKAEIEKLVASISKKGTSVLFISSELEEVVRNCHRVTVLRDRAKIGDLVGDEIGEDRIMGIIAKST